VRCRADDVERQESDSVYECMYMQKDVMAERQDKDGEEDDEMRQGGKYVVSQPQAKTDWVGRGERAGSGGGPQVAATPRGIGMEWRTSGRLQAIFSV
jgi:hypothetical protein